MEDLREGIVRSCKYGTLDYKWAIRDYLGKHPNEKSEFSTMLISLSESSFQYYEKYKETIQADSSLRAVASFCLNPELIQQVHVSDKDVEFLSGLFNQMVHSTRGLHRCYDCGTNARAMFLKLISEHRQKKYISPQEQLRMTRQYVPRQGDNIDAIRRCRADVLGASEDTVFICSLGLDGFGHVWIIEKRFFNGKPRYHHYQTSFRSHLLLDFIEHMDYGKHPEKSLDIEDFFDKFMQIMTTYHSWTDAEYQLFSDLFAFLPSKTVTKPDPSYCYTYITY